MVAEKVLIANDRWSAYQTVANIAGYRFIHKPMGRATSLFSKNNIHELLHLNTRYSEPRCLCHFGHRDLVTVRVSPLSAIWACLSLKGTLLNEDEPCVRTKPAPGNSLQAQATAYSIIRLSFPNFLDLVLPFSRILGLDSHRWTCRGICEFDTLFRLFSCFSHIFLNALYVGWWKYHPFYAFYLHG